MDRIISVWENENNPEEKAVGELIINGNEIEFYSRFSGEIFPSAYIGRYKLKEYKVFTSGYCRTNKYNVVEDTVSHNVLCVLCQNSKFKTGNDIDGIRGFTFHVPELINWIGLKTVVLGGKDSLTASEIPFNSIVIREEKPRIEIYFESKTFESFIRRNPTAITLKKEPRIKVSYDKSVNINTVQEEIECIMQFFGLAIGSISEAKDIRLSIEGEYSSLFLNRDFSYNLQSKKFMDKPRSYLYVLEENLLDYFKKWRNFYYDENYSFLRRIYFSVNNKKDRFSEDIFVEYMRILDGYHTRAYGDEKARNTIKLTIKDVTKIIKEAITTKTGKIIFEENIKKVYPDWKANSAHMEEIANWIASGFVGKTQLSNRLKELDNDNLQIIKKNAPWVEKTGELNKGKNDDELIDLFYKELGDTRNFYSHYKADKCGVFNFNQLYKAINVLKATIISIMFAKMGIEKDMVRKLLMFDDELIWETKYLQEEGEVPFKEPIEIINEMREKNIREYKDEK